MTPLWTFWIFSAPAKRILALSLQVRVDEILAIGTQRAGSGREQGIRGSSVCCGDPIPRGGGAICVRKLIITIWCVMMLSLRAPPQSPGVS